MYTLVRLDPAEIDLSSGAPFRFRFALPHEEDATSADAGSVSSVEKLGVLNPPILVRSGDVHIDAGAPSQGAGANGPVKQSPEHHLVSGFRRVSAALASGIRELEVLLIDSLPEDSSVVDVWLNEILTGSQPSEVERVILLAKLKRLKADGVEKHREELSAIFGRNVTREYAAGIVEILKEDRSTLTACHRGFLRADELLRLKLHPAIDQSRAASLLMKSGAGSRERKEIIHLIEILGGKDPDTLSGFLEKIDRSPAAPENILRELRRLTYPALSSLEASLRNLSGKISLPVYAGITYPENLEGSSLTLSVRFRRKEELELVIEKMAEALSRGIIDEMLSILRGDTPGTR